MFDSGILNGKVWVDSEFVTANLYVTNGSVRAISTDLLPCVESVDASGKAVLPGFIDPHVHFSLGVGARKSSDDFRTGSLKGSLGGITTYIDFLDPVKTANSLDETFEERMQLAKGSVTDFSFHSTIANPVDSAEAMIDAGLRHGLPSVKLFTTYSDTDRRTYDGYIYELLKISREKKTRIVAHAENDNLLSKADFISVADHERSRPAVSESSAVLNLALMAKETNGLLYIVHVSTGSTVEKLEAAFAPELRSGTILLESCPHYFVLSSELYAREDGWRYTMTPPLRSDRERLLLRDHLSSLTIIGTDHCPFSAELKNKKSTRDISMGIGGIQYSFVNLFSEFGSRVIPHYTSQPAKAYGLYPRKGNLLPGADADIVVFDEKATWSIQDTESPYDGRSVTGKIDSVFLRGKKIVENGVPLGGEGTFIRRELRQWI